MDSLLTAAQAADLVPSHPSPVAVWRWMRHGVKSRSGLRVRLRHVRFGSRLYTTAQDLERFAAELADADARHFNTELPAGPGQQRSTRRRTSDLALAEKRLKDAGIV